MQILSRQRLIFPNKTISAQRKHNTCNVNTYHPEIERGDIHFSILSQYIIVVE